MPKALSRERAKHLATEGNPFLSRKWGDPTDRDYFMLGSSRFHLSGLLDDAGRILARAYQTDDREAMQARYSGIMDVIHLLVRDAERFGLETPCSWELDGALDDGEGDDALG